MHITRAAICIVAILAWTSSAIAILVEDYVAVRILEPPAEYPSADCQLYSGFSDQPFPCGAGPGFAGGIDNAGNIVGSLQTTFPHRLHAHDLGRWLRSTGYTGENMGKFRTLPGQIYRGEPVNYPGPPEDPHAFGFGSTVKSVG